MNSKTLKIIAICLILSACGGGGGSSNTSNNNTNPPFDPPIEPSTPVPTSGHYNKIKITPSNTYVCGTANHFDNAPCITLTVCQVGTSNCDTVDNVLVDTGSFGLRIFKSVLPNTANLLTPMKSGNNNIAECISYADGTSNWGPVEYVNIILGTTPSVESLPIQIIDASFPGISSSCPGAAATPAEFEMNGIIGVGPLTTDQLTSAMYYSCNSLGSCTQTTPPEYLPNPITKLGAGNNNGLTLTFGAIPQSGTKDADGYMIFGVGSYPSNTPPLDANVFRIDDNSPYAINVDTVFNGVTNHSFLDTGSNFFYFSNQFLPLCENINKALCPADFTSKNATMNGLNPSGGLTTATINFSIGNAENLFSNGNTAYNNIGFVFPGLGTNIVDWGMPFFYGKTVYIVFAGESASFNQTQISSINNPLGYWIY